MTPESGRTPPFAVEAEQIVLGSALYDAQAVWTIQEHLSADDFYTAKHRAIAAAIFELARKSAPIDVVSVTEELKRADKLAIAGGAYYVTDLSTRTGTPTQVEWYVLIVKEKAMLRRLILITQAAQEQAYDPATDVFDAIDQVERDILAIRGDEARGIAAFPDLLKETLGHLENIHGTTGGITGIPSGLPAVDELTTGWQKTDYTLVAARPSMGKTAFALQVARHAAGEAGIPTVIFSLEMGARQCAQRFLCSAARIDQQTARSGRLKEDQWPVLARAAGRLSKTPIYIDDTPALSEIQLRAKVRRLKHEHDIGMVIVDYLQLMHATQVKRSANREQEIGTISRSLKALAMEMDMPVIALSQLSRAVETRGGDKRPQLSDLRESGSLEQDADNVMFLYRPEYYGITVDENGNSTEGIAEAILAKQRNGPIGTRRLVFIREYGRFEPLASRYQTGFRPPDRHKSPDMFGGESDDTAPF